MTEKTIETKNKVALKSAVWYIFSNFFLKGITFITMPIFARLLKHSEFGQFNNYSAWVQIMTIFVTLNIQASLITAKYEFKEKIDEFTLSIFCLSSISALIWASVLNVFKNFFVNFFDLEIYYINCMIIYLFFSPALVIFQLKTRLSFKYKENVILSVITATLTEVLSVILVLTMADKLHGRILGAIIPTIIVGLGMIIYFAKKGKRVNVIYWKYALKLCIPYMFHSLSLVMLSSMDKVMITKICGSEETALYSLASNCGLVILLLVTSLNDAFTPWLGEKLDKNKLEDIRKFSKMYMVIFCLLAFGLMLIIPEILLLLGGKSYLEAKFVLAPVALGCIYQFLYKMFVNVEQLKKKTLGMSLASISAAILNYVLNIIFINKFGYIAAAYTTVASYIWLLIIHMIVVYKIGYSNVYDYRFVIMLSCFVLLLTIIINFLYLYWMLRCVFVIIYVCVLGYLIYENKDKIVQIIKLVKVK